MYENDKFIFLLRMNIYKYFLIILLFPLFSSDNLEKRIYTEPYITAIFTGNGTKGTVSYSSRIRPKKVYLTDSHEEIKIKTSKNNYPINIISNSLENNITMEFDENSFQLEYLFGYIKHFKKVDLSHFNVKPRDTSYMFYYYDKLEEIIFGKFNTSLVTTMAGMFQGTEKLTILDLSGFNTQSVINMKNMFNNCKKLIYLDLRNFDFSKATNTAQMLDNCKKINFLNIYSFKDGDSFDLSFFSNLRNLIYCINEIEAPNLSNRLKNKGFISNCSYLPSELEKYNEIQIYSSNDINYLDEKTIKIFYSDSPFIGTNSIDHLNCSSEDFFKRKCGNNSMILSIKNKDNLINNIMNDIIYGKLNSLLDNITSGEKEDYITIQGDTTFQITTSENQNFGEYNNISTIHLGKCEEILKEVYEIHNLSLIILKVDYFMKDFKIPIIGYEVFHPINKTKLDLSLCENETVDYHIPVDIKEEYLEKYNISSDYYNDECSVYTTEDGTDIIILDRKKEFNDNNMFLCENNCNYTNYNTTTKKSVCMCDVKSKIYSISEIFDNKDSLSKKFNVNDTSTSSSNLGLMKCIDTLFSKYGLLKNLENYILILMIILYVISSILFYRIGSALLENDIKEILDNKYEIEKNIKKISKKKSSKKKIKKIMANPRKKRSKSTTKKKGINKSITINKNELPVENNKSMSKFSINKNSIDIANTKNIAITKVNLLDYEINTLSYKEALIYDKRNIIQIYFSLLRKNHPLLFSFIPSSDYNTMIIKIDLFILKFAICSAINALFFTENTIHKIYSDKGSYKLGFYLPKIILSFIFTHIIMIILKYIFLSERNITKIKNQPTYDEASEEADKEKSCLIIKYILFYVIGIVFLFLFWFYLSSFCAVYQNTQIFLIINTFISLGVSFFYPLIINFIPSLLRNISLRNYNRECMYITSKILQII